MRSFRGSTDPEYLPITLVERTQEARRMAPCPYPVLICPLAWLAGRNLAAPSPGAHPVTPVCGLRRGTHRTSLTSVSGPQRSVPASTCRADDSNNNQILTQGTAGAFIPCGPTACSDLLKFRLPPPAQRGQS